ncbi:MAG: D-sedoheptulose 7-phosphate isomerase [Bacteroidales bacterium]|nr:D-sedoheptulose 7-phosphate isomerase [Bacteroidales bacterium]MBR6846914.1 D-sedoheptulose 7-phosphate isomerase [Bacteroidales bacterium]
MNTNISRIQQSIEDSIAVKQLILNDKDLLNRIEEAFVLCVNSLKLGGKIWLAGNGGSAADAQHIAAELSGRFYLDRNSLPAEALHVNGSFITAVANDYGFDKVYARMLQGCAHKGDVLFAISTSGNSANILEAVEMAKSLGMHVIALTGETGGKLRERCDILLNVPSHDTPRIQECHIMIGHIICEHIEKELFG